jgi:carotenoid cleavage dioxygenase-like enzyme
MHHWLSGDALIIVVAMTTKGWAYPHSFVVIATTSS